MAIRFMYLDMSFGQLRRREWVARFVCSAPAIRLCVCLALDRCWRHEVVCMDRNTWKRCCKTETDKSVRNCTRNMGGGGVSRLYIVQIPLHAFIHTSHLRAHMYTILTHKYTLHIQQSTGTYPIIQTFHEYLHINISFHKIIYDHTFVSLCIRIYRLL
jgi:hypothetical protein